MILGYLGFVDGNIYFCNLIKISEEERNERSSKLACADFKMDVSTVEMINYYKVKFYFPQVKPQYLIMKL